MNVSSVKNLNGETFSAVQDATLTDVVQSNSAQWNDKIDSSAVTFRSISNLGNFVSGISGCKLAAYSASNSEWANYAGTAIRDSLRRIISATYQTTADMTAYQPTLTFGYDEQDRISAINNSAFAAGDEFPASANEAITAYQTNSGDYLKESELGYNAVDEVSAINGSAIAQYGAEKQWLVHDRNIMSFG